MKKEPWIGVLDCNNFFVSCERLFRPDLVGKPVVVLSSNDGCVVARSQEIKDMGVPMGVPYFKIKDTLKKEGATTFSSHFSLYRDVSRRVFQVMRKELEIVEQYSIDEAFFAIDSNPKGVAKRLKNAVEKEVGIPVSVGIGKTKTQAKFASTIAKKEEGVCVLNEALWQSFLEDIPLAKIWGIGGKMELRYKKHGLETVADLTNTDESRIAQLFGVNGVRLQQELKGFSVFKVGHIHEPQKSILSSRSFRNSTTEFTVLADAVAYHVRHAMADLRSMKMKTSVIRVSIRPSRHGDFLLRGGTKEAFLTVPSNDSIELLKVANDLLKELFEEGVPYKKAGVMISNFISEDFKQENLFESENKGISEGLMSVIDHLNSRKGKEVVLLGSRLRSSGWQTKVEVKSPSYTTRWSDIANVKAS